MADLDSLQIKVNASAADASKSLEKLAASMKSLRDNLNVDTQKLQGIATSIRNLSDAASGFKGGKSTELTSLSRALKSFNGIDTNSIYGITAALKNLTNGLSGAKNIDVSGITGVAASLAKLGGKNATTGVSNLLSMKDQLAQFITGMNSVGSLNFDVSGLSNLISGLSKMGGKASTQATKNLPTISAQLQNFVRQMNQIGSFNFDMTNLSQMVTAIGKLGSVASGREVNNIPLLAKNLKELFVTLSSAPNVSGSIIRMTEALANLSNGLGRTRTVTDRASTGFKLFGKTADSIRSKSFSLAAAIGKVYATYWTLFRAFRLLGKAIDISSSLTEVENVVRQTFGQYESLINNFAKTSIEKFGMSELSAKQFASRFQAMGTALDIPQGEMAKMSIRLTELAGDMASFYDVSQEDIAKSLQSVFSGTTAPMRRYGIDLTQATLKEWALKQGLDANISSMTQAQKAMLRYQYVLAHTTNITGDFARTADTWHNQVTLLRENFKALGAVVGSGLINAFKPFLHVLNAVLQKVISFAEMVTNALGSIFGWKYEASKGAGLGGLADDIGSASDGMDDLAGSSGDAAKNTGNAAKKAKDLKDNVNKAVRAFDELKTISLPDKKSNSGSGSGNKGSGSGSGAGGGTGADGGLVQTDTIFKKFKSNIKDLEGLGEAISGALISAMQSIDWDSVYAAADGFGTGLAQFLNGLFKDQKGTTLFGEVGKTIAGALNTVLHGLDSFGTTFDWKQFGKSISDGINNFFSTFDWKLAADTFNTLAHGILDAADAAVSGTDWTAIGQDIGTLLSGIDWIGLLSDVGKLIWEALKAAIETWKGMFDKAPFETSILTALGLLKLTGAGSIIVGRISKAVQYVLKSKGLSLGKIAFGLGMAGTTVFLMDSDNKVASIIGAPITAFLAGYTFTGNVKLSLKIAAPVLAADAGLTIGQAIGDAIADATQPEEMEKYRVTFTWSDLFTYSLDDWKQGFSDWWNDTLGPAFELMALDMATGNYKFKIPFTDIELPSLNEAKKGFTNWLSGVNKYWSKKKDSVLEIGAKIKNKASELWNGFKKDWKNGKEKAAEFKTKISSKAKDLWEKFKTSWGNSKVASFLLKIGSKAKDLWSNFKTAWGESKTAKFFLKIGSKISELWKDFKESWGEKKTVKFLTKRATKISELWKDFKDSWGDKKAVTIGIGFVKNSLNNLWSSVKGFFGGKAVNVGTKATKKADGGVFSGGRWHDIKRYAAGGVPDMGQMFVAREAGPELVGTLGGHTAVMNNDQIVSSVANGVAQATEAVLRSYFRGNANSGQPIQIVLDGKVIFDSTRRSAQEFFNRTGTAPYPV